MTSSFPVRRIVIGINGRGELGHSLDFALEMASGMGIMLNCLQVDRVDLLAAAALPFARITSQGGISSPVTRDDMAACLRRVTRAAEEQLVARCREVGVRLSLERAKGEYASELLSIVSEGDVVIVDHDVWLPTSADIASISGDLLQKAMAVVLLGTGRAKPGSVIVVAPEDEEEASLLARNIAEAFRLPLRRFSPQQFPAVRAEPAIVTLPECVLHELGGLAEVRKRTDRASTLIFARDRGWR